VILTDDQPQISGGGSQLIVDEGGHLTDKQYDCGGLSVNARLEVYADG
jgi:hypothetical protein